MKRYNATLCDDVNTIVPKLLDMQNLTAEELVTLIIIAKKNKKSVFSIHEKEE